MNESFLLEIGENTRVYSVAIGAFSILFNKKTDKLVSYEHN